MTIENSEHSKIINSNWNKFADLSNKKIKFGKLSEKEELEFSIRLSLHNNLPNTNFSQEEFDRLDLIAINEILNFNKLVEMKK